MRSGVTVRREGSRNRLARPSAFQGRPAMARRVIVVSLAAVVLLGCGDKGEKGDTVVKKPGAPPAGSGGYSASPGGYGYTANLGSDLDKAVGEVIAKGK